MPVANKTILSIAESFSGTPGPRFRWEGTFSGEQFREEVLEPEVRKAITSNTTLVVVLDKTAGLGTSFLEESFGGLIRKNNYSYGELQKHIDFVSVELPYLIDLINNYLKDADAETKK